MSSWNYRVVRRGNEFAVHEAFYAEDGRIQGLTVDPVYPRAETLEDLRDELARYRKAFDLPVLLYDDHA